MKKFWKLFNFEYNRLAKILFPGVLIALAVQLFELVQRAMAYHRSVQELSIANPSWSAEEIMAQLGGQFSILQLISSPFFFFPFIGITAIFLFYAFFTWYREWFSKNTFIYRLLMLPISRMQIYFSKLLVFIVGGMSALMTQFLAFYGFTKIAELIVTPEFMETTPFYTYLTDYPLTALFYSISPWYLLGMFGVAITFLSILFVIILAERSFRVKGIIIGALVFVGYLTSIIIINSDTNFYSIFGVYLLPSEQLKLLIGLHGFWLVLATFVNRYLLEHKVTV